MQWGPCSRTNTAPPPSPTSSPPPSSRAPDAALPVSRHAVNAGEHAASPPAPIAPFVQPWHATQRVRVRGQMEEKGRVAKVRVPPQC